MTPEERARDTAARVKKNHARIKAEWLSSVRKDRYWQSRQKELEAALLKSRPHLSSQRACGLDSDIDERPRRRIICPNGVVLLSTWYKVPTTDADARLALRETRWLNEQYRERQRAA